MQSSIVLSNPKDAYLKQRVLTASPIELVIMLYDALKKNVVLGQRAIGKEDASVAHKYLMKAQDIVVELMNSLDMNFEISGELLELYEFILSCLEEANMKKSGELLPHVAEIVDDLRGTWIEVAESQKRPVEILEQAR